MHSPERNPPVSTAEEFGPRIEDAVFQPGYLSQQTDQPAVLGTAYPIPPLSTALQLSSPEQYPIHQQHQSVSNSHNPATSPAAGPQFTDYQSSYHNHSLPQKAHQLQAPGLEPSLLEGDRQLGLGSPLFDDMLNFGSNDFDESFTNAANYWASGNYASSSDYLTPNPQLVGSAEYIPLEDRLSGLQAEVERFRNTVRHNHSETEKLIEGITRNEKELELWAGQVLDHIESVWQALGTRRGAPKGNMY